MKKILGYITSRKPRKIDIVLILVLVAGLVYLNMNVYLTDGLFESQMGVEDAYIAKQDTEGNTYVVDGGHTRVMKLNPDREVLFSIIGNNKDVDTISYVSDLAVAANGDIFVEENHWGGMYVDREAILVYDGQGRYKATCFDELYDEEYVDKRKIYGMTIDGDKLYFAHLQKDAIEIERMDVSTYEMEPIASYSYENAFNAVYDINIVPETESVYVLDKRGQVVHIDEGSPYIMYSVSNDAIRKGQTALYMMCVDKDGEVYLTDIKSNEILHLNQEGQSLEVLLTGGAALSINDEQNAEGDTVLTAVYDWQLCQLDTSGNVLFQSDILYKSPELTTAANIIYVIMGISALALLMLFIRLIFMALGMKITANTRNGLLLSAVVIIVVGIIVVQLMSSFREVYVDELFEKLYISANIVSSQIDAELVENVNAPEDFMNDAYNGLISDLERILDRRHEFNQSIYCNILKYEDGEAFSIAYLDQSTGTYYPLDEIETEEVLQVYETGLSMQNGGKEDVAGSFAYVKVPMLNDDGQVAAVIAIGCDTSIINDQISAMQNRVLITLVTIILIMLFLFGEGLGFFDLRGKYKQSVRTNPDSVPLHMVRVVIFATFIAFNMATSFLSVYASRLVGDNIGISRELAASLPITLNLAFMGIMSLFCAPLMSRFQFKTIAVVSAGICFAGDITIFLNSNYYALIGGLILNGIGVGLITNCINMFLASAQDPDLKRDGFSIFNSSSTSGINIGSMIGASLAGVMGQQQVFLVSATFWILVGILFLSFGKLISKASVVAENTAKKRKMGTLRFISSPRVLGYMICLQIPYIMLNSFIFYYVPIYAAEQGFSETITSILLVVYSMCSVFLGVTLTDFFIKKFKNFTMYVATAMSLAALLLFGASPTVPVLIVTLLIMGISSSFGVSTQSVYFTQLPQVKAYGEEESMGIYNLSDNVGQSVGPMVFGTLMASGNLLVSMAQFVSVIFAAGAFYAVGSLRKGKN